jgi:hypothetical protein
MESAVVAGQPFGLATARYLARQAAAGAFLPKLVHDHLPPVGTAERAGPAYAPAARRTIVELRALEADQLTAALAACKSRGLTLTAALSAAALLACSDVAHTAQDARWHNYKFLLAVDLRRFGAAALNKAGKHG